MERQKTLVIDASVAVKWFLNEENSDKARNLKNLFLNEELKLMAPSLIFLEISNALRYGKQDENELVRVNKNVFGLNLKITNLYEDLLSKAIKNSAKYDITIYDALYVALAQTHKTELITADRKLVKIPNVISLKDFDN